MPLNRQSLVLTLSILLFPAPIALAVTITWTGGAATNSWHTPGNWDLNRVPGVGDDVVIPDMTPNVNVTFSSGTTTINSLTSAEAFTLTNGAATILTVQTASTLNGPFNFNGGLAGAGDVTVNGLMTWTGFGTMSGTGRTIIATTGSLTISDSNPKSLNRTLENHSSNFNWTSGNIQMNNGTLSNESDGTFTISVPSDLSFLNNGGTNSVTNAGTINKTTASTISSTPSVAFNNSGTVNLDAGGLFINGGGTNSGTIDADAGTTLTFNTSYTHGAASSLTGLGTLTFAAGTHSIAGILQTNRIININGGAIINFNAPYAFTGTLNLAGTLSGSADVTVSSILNWTGFGTMSGTGRTVIATTGSLTISDSNPKSLNRTLENHSSNFNWTSGNIQMNNGTLSNESDGTFTISVPSDFNFHNNGGTNSVTNAGTINKTTASTISSTPSVAFNNSGTVNLDAGVLFINGGGTNSGTIDADAGTTLMFNASYTHGGASSLTGLGMLTFAAGTHSIAGILHTNRIVNINGGAIINFNAPYAFTGTLNLAGTLSGSADVTVSSILNWTGFGTMSGTGRTVIATTGSLTISDSNPKSLNRTLENHSSNFNWTSGNIQMNNGTLSNESDGTFTISVPSDFNFHNNGGTNSVTNAGTINKTTASTISSTPSVAFNNSGTVNLDAGGLFINGGGTNSGTIDADAGTTLTFNTSYTHGAASSLTGLGTLTFAAGTHSIAGILQTNRIININGGAIINFNAPYAFTGTLNLAGTLSGSADVTVSSILNWTGFGTMSGTGRTVIATTGSLTISDSNPKSLNRTLENHSSNFNWTSGNIQMNNGTLENEAGGVINASHSTDGSFIPNGGINSITNSGIFNKISPVFITVSTNIPFTNNGTLNVQSGTLSLAGGLNNFSGTTLTGGTYNVAATLQFTAANIVTNAATIILDGPTSAIQNTANANALANFATNNPNATFQIKNGRNFALTGAHSNAGQVTIGPGDATFSASTFSNSGTITKLDTSAGSINSTVTQTATGIVDVQGGMLTLTALTNQSGTTLTGGTYKATGTLRYGNANIVNNAAAIILDGPASVIESAVAVPAFANFATNAAPGVLQLRNGRNLALAGDFNNVGQVILGPSGGALSLPGSYVQSAGVTQLDDGTLDPANTVDVQGGELKGNGSILAAVTNSGTCKPGLSPGSISITGDYTQTVAGTLEVEVGGTTAITQYDRLSVSGNAILLGTLRILLINGFAPAVADTFDIVTGEVSTKFSNIHMPVLPSLHGFQVEAVPTDQPTTLRLNVINCGPSDADNDGVGDACDTPPELTSYTIAGGGVTFSSGGEFRLGCTIGQPAATSFSTPMTGGIFTVVGGFWAGTELVETPACSLPGDMNLDGSRNGKDIRVFAQCVISGGGPGCDCADLNESGTVTTADIAPFVQLLIN